MLGGLIPENPGLMIFDAFIIHPQMSQYHIIHQLSKVKPSILYHQTSNRVKSVSSNSNNIICLENKFTKQKSMSIHFGLVFLDEQNGKTFLLGCFPTDSPFFRGSSGVPLTSNFGKPAMRISCDRRHGLKTAA